MVCFYKQDTAYEVRISDWSSDVCSSDLLAGHADRILAAAEKRNPLNSGPLAAQAELLPAIEDAKGLSAVVERLHRMAPQSPATAIAESRLALLRGDPRAAQEKLLAARQLAGDRKSTRLNSSN